MKVILLAQGAWCHDALKAIKKNKFLDILALVGDSYSYTLISSFNYFEVPKSRADSDNLIMKIISIHQPDMILSIQYPHKISNEIIKIMHGNIFNIHNAKLPEYRGHNCLTYEILNNEKIHITTFHKITKELDRGYLVNEISIKILKKDTAYSLWNKSKVSAAKIISEINSKILHQDYPIIIGNGKFYSKHLPNKKKFIDESTPEIIKKRFARAFWFPPKFPAHQIKKDGTKEIIKL